MNPWEASVPEWITAVASVGALLGLIGVWIQLRLQKQQLIREIESDYVERYWLIRDHIDEAEPGSTQERRWRLAYVRLCEDQIDLRSTGRNVTDETWTIWDSAMRFELRRLAIYRELVDDPTRSDELHGVRTLLSDPVDVDGQAECGSATRGWQRV